MTDTGTVRGRVLDATTLMPLIGTTIVATVDGEKFGTVTDLEGRYVLSLPTGERRLSFTYVGYTSSERTIIVDPDTRVDALLEKEGQPDAEAAASVSSVKVTGDRKPLEEQNILYIVDGKRYPKGNPTRELHPGRIEKITVYREASDIAPFGHGTDFDGAIVIELKEE